jgi:hypothetical protein
MITIVKETANVKKIYKVHLLCNRSIRNLVCYTILFRSNLRFQLLKLQVLLIAGTLIGENSYDVPSKYNNDND